MLKVQAISGYKYTVFSRDFATDGEETLKEVGTVSQDSGEWTANCRGFDLGGFDSLNEAVVAINDHYGFDDVCHWRMV